MPEQIERLIYAAGFLLKDGDSVIDAMQRDPDGEFLPELVFSADQSSVTAAPNVWRDKAFHDVTEATIAQVLPLVDHAQSMGPFAAKFSLSEKKFGSVPKLYIDELHSIKWCRPSSKTTCLAIGTLTRFVSCNLDTSQPFRCLRI